MVPLWLRLNEERSLGSAYASRILFFLLFLLHEGSDATLTCQGSSLAKDFKAAGSAPRLFVFETEKGE